MKRFVKSVIIFTIFFTVAMGLAGCEIGDGRTSGSAPGGNSGNNIKYTGTLRVYNASEYMDMATVGDFEREFAIKVEYFEFESNEDMYDEISKNPGAYDVLVPSDYTADRLIKEGKLAKIDKSKVTNLEKVAEEYLNPSYDPNNDYVVPYMVGTLGILYNTKKVTVPVDSWTALFAAQYSGKLLMLNSERDTIGATLKMLGFSMNSSNDTELAQVKLKLQTIRPSITAYNESEEIRDKMVAGEGVLGVVYSGDAKIAVDRNPDLAYVIPKEGTNKWVDGFVVMKDTQQPEAAQNFINFMCRPNIAVRNMTNIGYTSPIKGAGSEFGSNKIMFPAAEELARCETFLYDSGATPKYHQLWQEVRK